MTKIEEMYVLMDGTQADPSDVSKGDDGVLRHKNGVKVAMRADGRPETIADRTALNAPAEQSKGDEERKEPVAAPPEPERPAPRRAARE